jgi:hypothetical protein
MKRMGAAHAAPIEGRKAVIHLLDNSGGGDIPLLGINFSDNQNRVSVK